MSSRQEPLDDVFRAQLSELLAARLGLHFPRERWTDLDRGLALACRELGFSDAASCARGLVSAPLTQGQVEVLASHLTVGETYFMRDARSFEILEQRIVPELLRARGEAEWRLRIWSAGCCTGEEPYSIAMVLDRALPLARRRNVSILATDVNPRFLAKAARGVYGEWSFRATPGTMRERYFTRRKDGRYEINPEVRRMVTFSYLNLAEEGFPSLATNTNALDVVFCRNVLMYFPAERVAAMAHRLHCALCDGGWLFVSPGEMSQALFPQFAMVNISGVLAYRKSAHGTPANATEPRAGRASSSGAARSRTTPRSATAPPWAQEAASFVGRGVTQAPSASALAVNDEVCSPIELARREADAGRLDAALEWSEEALAADRLEPVHHYLHAVIQIERGEHEAAARAFERALYLAPEFVLAHVALGNLRMGQGRPLEARRHFDNALELLRRLPPESDVPESGGLSAERMADIVEGLRVNVLPASIASR